MASKDLERTLENIRSIVFNNKDVKSYVEDYRKRILDIRRNAIIVSPEAFKIGFQQLESYNKEKELDKAFPTWKEKTLTQRCNGISKWTVKELKNILKTTHKTKSLKIINNLQQLDLDDKDLLSSGTFVSNNAIYSKAENIFIFQSFSSLSKIITELRKRAKNQKIVYIKVYYGAVDVGHTLGAGSRLLVGSLNTEVSEEASAALFQTHKPIHEYKDISEINLTVNKDVESVIDKLAEPTKQEVLNNIAELKTLAIQALDLELELSLEKSLPDDNKLYVRMVCTFVQPRGPNRATGGALTQIIKSSKSLLKEIYGAIGDPILHKGSKSPKEHFDQNITLAFYDKKLKSSKGKKTVKRKVTLSPKKSVTLKTVALPAAKPKLKKVPIKKSKSSMQNLNNASTLSMVNTRLHNQIQKNMGRGAAKEILNYRTGRFARSVELEAIALSRTGKTAEARVKYMQYPYGVFEPGGRLYKPGRDPHGIIGKSIRQILQEQKIINLARVGVQLHG